jgi:hypothetical protein
VYLSSTIDALGIRQHQFDLLGKLNETGAGISGGGDQDLGLPLLGVGVLIVNVRPGYGGVVVLQLYLLPQGLLFPPQFRWYGLAICC